MNQNHSTGCLAKAWLDQGIAASPANHLVWSVLLRWRLVLRIFCPAYLSSIGCAGLGRRTGSLKIFCYCDHSLGWKHLIQEVVAKKLFLTISLVSQCQDPAFTDETSIAIAIESVVGFSTFGASPFASTSGTLIRRTPSTFDDHKGHTLGGFRT